MNHVLSPLSTDASSVSRSDATHDAANSPERGGITDLLHDIRQPLSVIESLAYYLELTSTDNKTCTYLRQIRAMVCQANQILGQAKVSH